MNKCQIRGCRNLRKICDDCGRTVVEYTMPEPEWQLIETAPKDGTWVLCAHESGHVNICQYSSDLSYWRVNVNGYCKQWNPTHWQPLPEPPKETE